MIFVFGSNLAGRHGKGAAKYAKEVYDAEYGVGVGRTGNAYAIPTKDESLNTLPLSCIESYCLTFLEYARSHPYLTFYITPIGTGLAGYTKEEIKPFFKNMPDNCTFAHTWY